MLPRPQPRTGGPGPRRTRQAQADAPAHTVPTRASATPATVTTSSSNPPKFFSFHAHVGPGAARDFAADSLCSGPRSSTGRAPGPGRSPRWPSQPSRTIREWTRHGFVRTPVAGGTPPSRWPSESPRVGSCRRFRARFFSTPTSCCTPTSPRTAGGTARSMSPTRSLARSRSVDRSCSVSSPPGAPWLDVERRRDAEALAAAQWRPLGPLRILATDRRLLVWHDGAWASVWYHAIRELRPDLDADRLDLTFEVTRRTRWLARGCRISRWWLRRAWPRVRGTDQRLPLQSDRPRPTGSRTRGHSWTASGARPDVTHDRLSGSGARPRSAPAQLRLPVSGGRLSWAPRVRRVRDARSRPPSPRR